MSYTTDVIQSAENTEQFLEDSVKNHQRRLTKSIRELERKVINQVKEFKTSDGKLLGPKTNMKLAQKTHSELETLFDETYGREARRIVKGYAGSAKFIEKSFADLNIATTFTSVDETMMEVLQNNTWNTFNQFGLDAQTKLADTMYSSIIGGTDFATMSAQIGATLTGFKDKRGNTMDRYAELYAHDGIRNFHQQVTLKKAEDAGVENFLYYGNLINTSRDFCIARVGKTFTKDEIEAMGSLTWQGKSGPPLTNRGGYNCRHHWVPVHIKDLDPVEVEDELEKKVPKTKKKTVKKQPTRKKTAKTTEQTASANLKSKEKELRRRTTKGGDLPGMGSWQFAGNSWKNFPAEPKFVEAFNLHNEVFESRMTWYKTLTQPRRVEERKKVLMKLLGGEKGMVKGRKGVALAVGDVPRAIGRTVNGTQHMSYRLISELERTGVKIAWQNAPVRANYYRGKCTMWINDDFGDVVAHELAHAVDAMMSQGGYGLTKYGDTGLAWLNEGNIPGWKSRDKLRGFFVKQTNGAKGVYANGDGAYYKGNWMTNYEGRDYGRGSHRIDAFWKGEAEKGLETIGNQFWAMNVQRYNKAYTKAAKSVTNQRRIVTENLSRSTSKLEGVLNTGKPDKALVKKYEENIKWYKNQLTKLDDAAVFTSVEDNLRNDRTWQEVHEFYPEFADMLEDLFRNVWAT